ncbi:hypothetical protein HK102_000226 [Quaeritorhiza haematococci]|nr:hypothetical protein HK102_000226 [Quaeritorhiza haematococci]
MVCLDGSQTSQVALEFASEHLIKPNGVLYILHALPYGRSQSLISFPDEAQIGRDYESLSVQLYERAVETLKSNGLDPNLNNIHIKVEIREGDARQVIMDCCDALAPTTLVVGSRGRSNIKGMLLGSVSAYCLNHATIPVVVVRDPNRRDSYGHLSGEDGSIEAVSDRV